MSQNDNPNEKTDVKDPAVSVPVDMGTGTTNLPVIIATSSQDVLVDPRDLTPEALQQVEAVFGAFTIKDTTLILRYASEPQRKMSSFLDELLQGVRVKDVGVAGEMVMELSDGINLMQLDKVRDQLKGKEGLLAWIVNILSLGTNYIRAFYESQKAITDKFEKIEAKSSNRMGILQGDLQKLDRLIGGSRDQIIDLEIYIIAGDKIIKREIENYRKTALAANESRNLQEAAEVRDFGRQIEAFDTRLIRIKEAYIRASITTIEQVRLNQEAIRIEIQNLQDGILFTLPQMKILILQIAALNDTKEAQKAREAMEGINKRLSSLQADMSQDVYESAKKSQGSSLERVEQAQQIVKALQETIQNAVKLEEEGRKSREAAGNLLVEMKNEFTEVLNQANLDSISQLT